MSSGEEVVRGPLLLKVGFTRTVLFPASGSLELHSAHYSFTAVVFSLYTLLSVAIKRIEKAVGGSVSGNGYSCCAELSWNWDQSWNWSPAQTSPAGAQVEVVSCATTKPLGVATKLLHLLICRILG